MSEYQHDRRCAVVYDDRCSGPGELSDEPGRIGLTRSTFPAREVEFDISKSRFLGNAIGGPAEIGVEHRPRGVDDALQHQLGAAFSVGSSSTGVAGGDRFSGSNDQKRVGKPGVG